MKLADYVYSVNDEKPGDKGVQRLEALRFRLSVYNLAS
jgi:hypothetical protein